MRRSRPLSRNRSHRSYSRACYQMKCIMNGQAITQLYPKPISSYTFSGDNAWQALDGRIYYDKIPNSRWTNYQSPNANDYLGVNFGSPRLVNEIRAYFYDAHATHGKVRAPASYTAQYWDGSNWMNVPNQVHSPATPAGNDANEITFSQVTTQKVRLVMNNQPGFYVGVTELESWYPAAG